MNLIFVLSFLASIFSPSVPVSATPELHPPTVARLEPVTTTTIATASVYQPLTFGDLPEVWQCIAMKESTDNLRAVNVSSGDQGAFQFAITTWAEYAPVGYPTEPVEATLAQQYTVALRLWQAEGFRPWVTASLCNH